jgi:hypothetical protein
VPGAAFEPDSRTEHPVRIGQGPRKTSRAFNKPADIPDSVMAAYLDEVKRSRAHSPPMPR